jgi:hypothetical protein
MSAGKNNAKILYLFAEGSRASVVRRLTWVCNGYGVSVDSIRDRLLLSPHPRISLDQSDDIEALRAAIEGIGEHLVMVILDPLSELHVGGENERDQMAPILAALRQMSAAMGFTIVLIHHSPKPDNQNRFSPLRGSGALRAWHDAMLYFAPADVATTARKLYGEFRDAESFRGLAVRLEVDEDAEIARIVLDDYPGPTSESALHRYILDRLGDEGPLIRNVLRYPPGRPAINNTTLNKALAVLQEQGEVRPLSDARRGQRWEIVPSEEEGGS